ncbi:MAG: iron-sulfur cluster assembly scaffold protein [Kiritimatiellae bacterium]|nr:iron-sulfur cluster assembly scaffold protein [Kiritimatiellia bacterium]
MDSLYRADLLDHAAHPRHAARIPPGEESSRLVNSACGDTVRWRLSFAPDGAIASAVHDTQGCAICTAAASLLAERVPGLSPADARALLADLETRLRSATLPPEPPALAALNALATRPARLPCALLPLQALLLALPS